MKIVSLDNHRDPHPDRAKRLAGLRVPMHQDRVEEMHAMMRRCHQSRIVRAQFALEARRASRS
jgi:hypothetical protein